MTNFEYYMTFKGAIDAFEREKHNPVYNMHEGTSAEFIHWLYEENKSKDNDVELTDKRKFSSSNQVSDVLSKLFDCAIELRTKSTLNENDYDNLLKLINELKNFDLVPNINYQSIYDEALSMAYTLNKIEKETKYCAMCGGREDCGYSTDAYLSKICRILYSSEGYHHSDKYDMKKMSKNDKKG